jgi:hypothetical protein
MNVNDIFPSNYLKAADLQGRKVKVVIDGCEMKKFGDDNKLVIKFRGKDKAMVANKTNTMVIAAAYGSDTDEWNGREICLYSTKVNNAQGQLVDSIRVEAVQDVVTDSSIPF